VFEIFEVDVVTTPLPTGNMSDQQGDSGGGSSSSGSADDDLSGLSGFLFYAFIVHPITAWILRPGK
jgi:hypothetical protein